MPKDDAVKAEAPKADAKEAPSTGGLIDVATYHSVAIAHRSGLYIGLTGFARAQPRNVKRTYEQWEADFERFRKQPA